MDTSGFALIPFCCVGSFIPIIISFSVRATLSRVKKLSDDEKSFLTFIVFVLTLAISYILVNYMFRDLYVM